MKVENICLDAINSTIGASLEIKSKKIEKLKVARLKIEILKRFIRIISDLNIIENKKYLDFESDLQEISKMTSGWIKYLNDFEKIKEIPK